MRSESSQTISVSRSSLHLATLGICSVYLQINLVLGRYNVSSASCGYESFDRMTHDAVVALHKNVQIVVMQKCRVMKKLLSVNTFHSLWVATTQFFFHFTKYRAASADPKSANEQQFKLEWTIRVANSSIKMLLVKMNVVLTPAWLKFEMYPAPVPSSAHKALKCLVVRVRVSTFLVDIYV